MAIEHAERARALVGTRFRPQGRDLNGLDCIGVVLATFGIPADDVPRDYQLRGGRKQELIERLGKTLRKVRKLKSGDVMLMELSGTQLHLAVRTDAGFVHAHAGLRRVVETPGMPEWPVIGIYRKRGKA
jgi:hypothetical protein